jgi:feruloyl-CoA synthase
MRVEGLILLEEPPSIDASEITDKGSINQRAVLARREKEVAPSMRRRERSG